MLSNILPHIFNIIFVVQMQSLYLKKHIIYKEIKKKSSRVKDIKLSSIK